MAGLDATEIVGLVRKVSEDVADAAEDDKDYVLDLEGALPGLALSLARVY